MKPYHKILTVFKRDPKTKYRTLLNEYSTLEFKYLKDTVWEFTEKVDGTNIRIILSPEKIIIFKGKTDRAHIPVKLVNRLRELFPTNEHFPNGACLYGEGYGAGIQKGGENYQATQEFVLFDIKIGYLWLKRANVEGIAKVLGLKVVPVIGQGTLADMVKIVNGGFTSTWGNFEAEGIVARPTIGLLQRNSRRIICKLKCKDFSQ